VRPFQGLLGHLDLQEKLELSVLQDSRGVKGHKVTKE
jgi:hypothetical protein